VDRSDKIEARRLEDLLLEPPREVPYWISPIVPKGGKVLFGGQAKVGKSWFLLSLARAAAMGEPPFGIPGFAANPAKVLLIEQEIGEHGLWQRANGIFRDLVGNEMFGENFWYISREPELSFSNETGFRKLVSLIDEIAPEVLFLDPMGKLHDFDENDATEMSRLMNRLDLLLKRGKDRDMSIVLSHHFGKPPRGQAREDYDPLEPYNFRGSAKWKDDPDTLVTMERLRRFATPHEAWRVKVRWTLRHTSSPPDMFLRVNELGDGRVYFEREDTVPGIAPIAAQRALSLLKTSCELIAETALLRAIFAGSAITIFPFSLFSYYPPVSLVCANIFVIL